MLTQRSRLTQEISLLVSILNKTKLVYSASGQTHGGSTVQHPVIFCSYRPQRWRQVNQSQFITGETNFASLKGITSPENVSTNLTGEMLSLENK